jgi:hypothetical protein
MSRHSRQRPVRSLGAPLACPGPGSLATPFANVADVRSRRRRDPRLAPRRRIGPRPCPPGDLILGRPHGHDGQGRDAAAGAARILGDRVPSSSCRGQASRLRSPPGAARVGTCGRRRTSDRSTVVT